MKLKSFACEKNDGRISYSRVKVRKLPSWVGIVP